MAILFFFSFFLRGANFDLHCHCFYSVEQEKKTINHHSNILAATTIIWSKPWRKRRRKFQFHFLNVNGRWFSRFFSISFLFLVQQQQQQTTITTTKMLKKTHWDMKFLFFFHFLFFVCLVTYIFSVSAGKKNCLFSLKGLKIYLFIQFPFARISTDCTSYPNDNFVQKKNKTEPQPSSPLEDDNIQWIWNSEKNLKKNSNTNEINKHEWMKWM